MAKRKAKKPQEDTSILLESSVSQTRRKINSYTSPALLFIIIFTVGASIMGWFCMQQQHSLDQLSETYTTMQKRITNLQQVMDMTDAQTDAGVEERIFALEEAQKQAQEKAEVALATSEKMKNSGHYSQIWELYNEMDARLTEIKQVTPSVTALQALFKNQSEDFEAVKESVVAGLSSSSALAETVAGLTNAVARSCARVDEQVASVEALDARLEGQASDLKELKESMQLHNVALHANNQEMAAIKELIESKQAMHAQALEEMLSSVQMTLDEQFFTSQTLRSSVMAQLQALHTQLANAPSMTSNMEGSAAEEVVSTATQNATEVQERLEDVEEKDEQQDAEEEEEEEEEMQEEQSLEQEAEGGIIEEEEEEWQEEQSLEQETEGSVIEEEEEEWQEEQPLEQEAEGSVIEEEEEEWQEEQPLEQEAEGGIIEEEWQEEQSLEQEAERGAMEEEEEEEITDEEETTPEEQEDEEITEQSEEQEDAAEEEVAEETVDETLEEEASEEVVESWEAEEEESAELNSDVYMDESEEDG